MDDKFKNEEEKRQWEQFQEYQRQQQEQQRQQEQQQFQAFQRQQQEQQYHSRMQDKQGNSKKWWFIGCGGCLGLIIIVGIIIAIATTMLMPNQDHSTSNTKGKTYKVGDTVKNGNLEIKLNSVQTMDQVGSSIAPTKAKGTFVVADLKIKNKGQESLTIDSSMFKLKSGDKSLEPDAGASVTANQGEDGSITNSFFLEQLNPDSTVEGKVVFDVSESVAKSKDKKLVINSSMISTKSVTFDLSNIKIDKSEKDDDDSDSNDNDDNGASGEAASDNSGSSSTSSASNATSSNHSSSSSNNESDEDTSESKADSSADKPTETKPVTPAAPSKAEQPAPKATTPSNSDSGSSESE
ncbi:DUF4352 domain-containing protein [Staphylococcus simiae]|uniref:DUF4352 domain-containing protein n=1 Tax=Staphylococcus simiae TaxID=308354 RepID=UPI001A961B3D|nr:DUF4352 domain-containing protein [Staphylococcus simiae]MBO1199206.1 DUF4352 domain-containing protein [Staphylococcus simiae]MBO1201391.1 DUF4352 domain-containing protein [Staphylococcus simiae]MBO1203555.1 DUF4352 domain-containing protein [Staphylococcus simiae]MBO1211178.1 DUF4352 domain-containing protein [Staphylococcus simiae]MBO1229745.1 DUF4352 domain-containing protein [Staphylococcus simiae]